MHDMRVLAERPRGGTVRRVENNYLTIAYIVSEADIETICFRNESLRISRN